MELTQKQERFCQNIAKGMNNTDAYKAAGYKVTNDKAAQACSSRMMGRDHIKKRLRELADEIETSAIMDIQEAQARLSTYARRTPQPDTAGCTWPTIQESIKAMEILIRIQGGFIDRQQIEMKGSLPVVIRNDVSE